MKRRCNEFYKQDREAWIPIYKDDDTQAFPIEPIRGFNNTQIDIGTQQEPLLTPELEVLEVG